MSKPEPQKRTKPKTIRRETCGVKDPTYFEIANCQEIIRACNAFFDRKGMPRNEYGTYGGFGAKRKERTITSNEATM